MTFSTAEQRSTDGLDSSSRSRFPFRLGLWAAVVIVFIVQVAAMFWVGNPPPVKPIDVPAAPKIHLAAKGAEELLALQDPTLFMLPHRDNFSGEGWLKIAPKVFQPTNWSEPPQPLPLPLEQLGAEFAAYMETNPPPPFQPRVSSGLEIAEADVAPMPPIASSSTVRVEGDLARLRLLTPVHLPPQTNADVLKNTVVQVLVDARGNPFSPVVLPGGSSGSGDVDALALTNYVKALRFEPAETAALGTVLSDKMTEGKLIFEWQTMAPAPTNAPTANP